MLLAIGLLVLALGWQAAGHPVIHVKLADKRYAIPSRDAAKTLCRAHNAQLATMAQLHQAQKAGYDKCSCGWLVDGVALPLVTPRSGCGTKAGIRHCPTNPRSWGVKGWNAYCAKDDDPFCPSDQTHIFGMSLGKYTIRQTDWAQLFLEITFPADGTVVGWNYYSMRADMQAYVAVWRKDVKDKNKFHLVGRSRLPLGRVGAVKYFVNPHYHIKVKKGDFIGIHYDSVIDWKNNNDAVIPMAQSPNNLCDDQGNCMKASDLGKTVVMHRHEEQLAYKRHVVIDLNTIKEKLIKLRAPSLRPMLCADRAEDLPKEVTTTTKAPVTSVKPTTPAATAATLATTPEVPELTETPETEPPTTTTEEPETTVTTETTTEPSPPPTTTTTEAPTTTTTTESATTGSVSVVTEAGPDVAEAAPKETPCHFPFMYMKQLVYACTSMNSDKPWCSTEEVYDGKNWRNCHEDDLQVEDMPCHFPFNYKGAEYQSCIKAHSNRPWCSVAKEYSPHGWKYCSEEDSVESVSCHIPFEYNGEQHSMCIKKGSQNFWCATAPKYGTYSWRNCREGDPIPNDMPCHFPFIFEGEEINTCIDKGSSKHWCAVEKNYNGENWRNCREGDPFPEEKPCHFPFSYNGKDTNACISENSNRPWCSLVPVYDYTKDWKYCRKIELLVLHDHKVKSSKEAEAECKKQKMSLAMQRDVKAAYELGTESCECGMVTSGKAVKLVQNPRADCNNGGTKGVHDCEKSADGYPPICVVGA